MPLEVLDHHSRQRQCNLFRARGIVDGFSWRFRSEVGLDTFSPAGTSCASCTSSSCTCLRSRRRRSRAWPCRGARCRSPRRRREAERAAGIRVPTRAAIFRHFRFPGFMYFAIRWTQCRFGRHGRASTQAYQQRAFAAYYPRFAETVVPALGPSTDRGMLLSEAFAFCASPSRAIRPPFRATFFCGHSCVLWFCCIDVVRQDNPSISLSQIRLCYNVDPEGSTRWARLSTHLATDGSPSNGRRVRCCPAGA